MLKPVEQMWDRYRHEKEDSDVAAFYGLMYFGELLTKLVACALISGIMDDRDRHRYGLLRQLVRADGIGEWSSQLDAALTGPSAQFLRADLQSLHRELSQRASAGDWQHESVRLLHDTLRALQVEVPPLPSHVPLRQWFAWFAILRNKTRGHGAPLGLECSAALHAFEESIRVITERLGVLNAEWAHLHRNLSGKYRVTALSASSGRFKHLRESRSDNLPDGIYLHAGAAPLKVELFAVDSSLSDFYLPNGQFRGSQYEEIAYATNKKQRADGKAWLAPATQLPDSETHGAPDLDLQGYSLSNVPLAADDFVARPTLQSGLESALLRDRHEIVSLSGPGGIGKTSLAVSVIKKIQSEGAKRFDVVVWFSARDIDLLPSGPKPVRPHGVSLEDFAAEYVLLVNPAGKGEKAFKAETYFAAAMSGLPLGPALYVFDNFETVTNPTEVFAWIDTYIRPPNKVLITTRTRGFVGDFPIEVNGMTESEALTLIDTVARRLGIANLLTIEYRRLLFDESSGHPYVMKIMLGEVAKAGRLIKPQRIIASQERILQALFERTFAELSPAAQRVFLLLCTWRSVIPMVAIEAVVMRNAEERIDVRAALDELKRLSFLEELSTEHESEVFVSVPLAAMTFGQGKLNASAIKAVIEADSDLLQDFGTIRKDGTASGVMSRVSHLIRALAKRVTSGRDTLDSLRPMLEFVASRVPAAWPEVARLYIEEGAAEGVSWAKTALRRYVESGDRSVPQSVVWRRLVELCHSTGDVQGELQSLAELANDPGLPIDELSELADSINRVFATAKKTDKDPFQPEDRKYLVGRLIAQLEGGRQRLDSTDLSRLAWLYMHTNNEARALELAELGLQLDRENEYCLKLAQRLRRH
jgi:NB-ARC domain